MSEGLIIQLQKQNRLMKQAMVSGGVFAMILISFVTMVWSKQQRFTEIDVERINIIMPDGKKEMVLANRLRMPAPVINGKEVKRDGPSRPGMLFYNTEGDENGGFIFDGELDENGKPLAGMQLSMDRFGGDQQLTVGHSEGNGFMETGLTIFDRGLEKDYGPIWTAYNNAPEGSEKEALLERWKAAGGRPTERVFIGRTRGRSSVVILADPKGVTRIMMLVTPEGEAKINFYDEAGNVIQSLPEKKVTK